MRYTTYILYSEEIGRYYVGYTSAAMEDRLRRHLTEHRGFTGRAKDWKVVFAKTFVEKSEATALERRIKKRGAKRFLADVTLT